MVFNLFKKNPLLVSVIVLTLITEISLIILVYNENGTERLFIQLGRLTFQAMCIILIFAEKSNKALFILTAYHIITALITLTKPGIDVIQVVFGVYHSIVGILIYFHDWFERKLRTGQKS